MHKLAGLHSVHLLALGRLVDGLEGERGPILPLW